MIIAQKDIETIVDTKKTIILEIKQNQGDNISFINIVEELFGKKATITQLHTYFSEYPKSLVYILPESISVQKIILPGLYEEVDTHWVYNEETQIDKTALAPQNRLLLRHLLDTEQNLLAMLKAGVEQKALFHYLPMVARSSVIVKLTLKRWGKLYEYLITKCHPCGQLFTEMLGNKIKELKVL